MVSQPPAPTSGLPTMHSMWVLPSELQCAGLGLMMSACESAGGGASQQDVLLALCVTYLLGFVAWVVRSRYYSPQRVFRRLLRNEQREKALAAHPPG
jgi:hypothetical protein